jgi:hypothetical protein
MSDDDLAYVLRCQSKRTDIPIDVVRTLSEAYAEIISLRQLLGNTEELRRERDEGNFDPKDKGFDWIETEGDHND